jgi:hypothetical protein
VLIYLGSAVLSLVIAAFVLQLWRADFNIPFAYEWRDLRKGGEALDPIGSNDALLFYSFFKGMNENGWYLKNPAIGAPYGLNFSDYPFADTVHFALIKALEWVTPNYAVAVNLYFLLGFPLAVLSCLFLFRQLKISWLPAVVGSLLFAFIPYHFLRGQQHLWLASYYPIPLLILVVFWAMEGDTLFEFGPGKRLLPTRITRRGWGALLIILLIGSTGVYYALFGVFFLAVGCLLRYRNWRTWFSSGLVTGALFATLALNAIPTLLYVWQHGKNPEIANHFGAESEYFGLKIIQMLLPVMHHRIDAFAQFASLYYNNAPSITENATATLGLVASAGFLILLGWQLGVRWRTSADSTLTTLSALNVCSVLLATIGGFSALLAFGVSPVIRCWNRFSIFIALFALMAIALVFEKLRQRAADSPGGNPAWALGAVVLLVVGLADQTTEFFVPPYAQNAASYQSDEHFVHQVEAKLPAGSMIFQFPYVPFPEGAAGSMGLLRCYLHSHTLRWTFGALKGRESDTWIRSVVLSDGNLPRIVRVLGEAGFKGICVDRQLLADHEKLEEWLKQNADPAPIESENGRLAFYGLPKPTVPAAK